MGNISVFIGTSLFHPIISISSFSGSLGSSYTSDCLVILNLVCLSGDHINVSEHAGFVITCSEDIDC